MKCLAGSLALLLAYAIFDDGFAQENLDTRFPKPRFVTSNPEVQDMWPCFSPDSQTLLFTRTTDRKTWNLYTIPITGGQPSPFPAKSPLSGTRANWSARHNLIAFNGRPDKGQFNLSVINGDGLGLRLLQSAGISDRMSYPSWYPDGKSIAVVDFSRDQRSTIHEQLTHFYQGLDQRLTGVRGNVIEQALA